MNIIISVYSPMINLFLLTQNNNKGAGTIAIMYYQDYL